MTALRQYLFSLTTAALICGLARKLTVGKGIGAAMVRTVSGIFLTMTVLSPLADLTLDGWRDFASDLQVQGEQAAARGENLVREQLAADIQARTAAYIQDKAAELGAEVTAEVTVSREKLPVPERVCIRGRLSPYARKKLEAVITGDLGILKENLQWSG